MKSNLTATPPPGSDHLLNRQALAELLGISPNGIAIALCRGSFPIPPIRIGRRLRWRHSDVQKFIATGGAQA